MAGWVVRMRSGLQRSLLFVVCGSAVNFVLIVFAEVLKIINRAIVDRNYQIAKECQGNNHPGVDEYEGEDVANQPLGQVKDSVHERSVVRAKLENEFVKSLEIIYGIAVKCLILLLLNTMLLYMEDHYIVEEHPD